MMDVEASYTEFISCDRTGRRNAVPDIGGDGAVVSAGELTKDMAEMALKTTEGAEPGGSPPPEGEGSTSPDNQGDGGPS